jgi:ligand-binding sensor domain-containing protein
MRVSSLYASASLDLRGSIGLVLSSLLLISACKKDEVTPETTFPASEVFALQNDPSGNLWAGTAEGLISLRDNNWKIHSQVPGLPADIIRDIAYQYIDGHDELWLGGPSGLSVAAYELDAISSATTYVKEPGKLLDNEVRSVTVDAIQARWAATPNGLSVFVGSNWYGFDDLGDLLQHDLNSLGADDEGWVFAGTSGLGVGRYKYDDNIDGITGASYYDSDWTGLPSDTILSVLILSNDNQWFGTTMGAAHHMSWNTKEDWETFDSADGLIHNQVNCIAICPCGMLWFGTPEGASSFDGITWRSYTTQEGLIHNQVNDVIVDSWGMVWFATPAGISSFDGVTWTNFSRD